MQSELLRKANLNPRLCEQARLTRDARFDGLFFIAVKSTGIYCRPVCPAPTPLARNVTYFPTAAAAAAAGYRPCLRCRPEAAPGSPVHRATQALVAGALRLIEEGALDNGSIGALAKRVGVGERHLRRLFVEQIGANPVEVNATRRVLFAKKLLSETNMDIAQVALASGYGSLRRFNSAFQVAYRMAPRDLRRKRSLPETEQGLTLRLAYREPYDFAAQLAFFALRAIPGVEHVDRTSYQRIFSREGVVGRFRVSQALEKNALLLHIQFPDATVLLELVARVRRMFDLDADMHAIHHTFAKDRCLRQLVKRHPGQRLPGGWDGFEIAVRAVLGQQISVAAARTFASRLVDRWGLHVGALSPGQLSTLFPSADVLAEADLTQIGLPRARAATIRGLARAVSDGALHFRLEQTLPDFIERCTTLPGIGEWTAHYIAMRALSQPDAFPAADLVLRKAVALDGKPVSAKALEQRSCAWRPWRAYAVLHLWRSTTDL